MMRVAGVRFWHSLTAFSHERLDRPATLFLPERHEV
jgi:hypothetical protein